MTELQNVGGLSKTTARIAGPDVGRIDVDFAAGAFSGLAGTQTEEARFKLLAVLIQLAQGKPSLILRNGPDAAERDDHNHDQKLEKRESCWRWGIWIFHLIQGCNGFEN